jgi:nanoRNase/pAp phosphatase (c-di-AMP/oligoRNAs hydrolase)
MVYALFPGCRVSMHVLWGLKQQNTVFAVGKSIVDRTSPVDVGALMLEHGGGGHTAAGTCQIANERAAEVQAELIGRLNTRSAARNGSGRAGMVSVAR